LSALRSRIGSPLSNGNSNSSSNGVSQSLNGTGGNNTHEANGKSTNGKPAGPFFPQLSALGSAQENRIRRIIQLIESEPSCTIHDLAEKFNLSHSHLQHLFKQHTGIRLGHLLTEQRLLKAAQLLENSSMCVKEIGYLVGYEHTSSFIRAFERRFAQAPRRYRLRKTA
jgi:transcriptional regulator GlxA family with amidase domain